jgi:hypothetical protein
MRLGGAKQWRSMRVAVLRRLRMSFAAFSFMMCAIAGAATGSQHQGERGRR